MPPDRPPLPPITVRGCPGTFEEVHTEGWLYTLWLNRADRLAVLEVPVQWHVVYSVWCWLTDAQWRMFHDDRKAFEALADAFGHDHGERRFRDQLLHNGGPVKDRRPPTTPQPLASL